MLQVGQPVPNFRLSSHQGEWISLDAYKGKSNVVVYFYPKALTPGCTTQACGLRDIHKELSELNTVVIGISPDPIEKLQKFFDKHSLNFKLLSDPEHDIANAYGVWGEKKFMGKEFMGIVRTTFIIDKEGCLINILNQFKTSNHHEKLLAILNAYCA